MLKKYLTPAVLVAVFAVGFVAPQLGRAQTADDAYIKTLQGIVESLLLQVKNLTEQLKALSASTSIKPLPVVPIPIPNPDNQFPTATISGPSTVTASTTASWLFRGFDPEGSLLSYTIYWGDGFTTTGNTSSGVTFAKPHLYHNFSTSSITRTIQFTVTDNLGSSGIVVFPVTILPYNRPPVVSVSGSSTVPAGVNSPWFFQATDPEGASLWWNQSWGDGLGSASGTMASGQTLTKFHAYNKPGTFNISFVATDPKGSSGSKTLQVSVVSSSQPGDTQAPTASITFPPFNGFYVSSTQQIVSVSASDNVGIRNVDLAANDGRIVGDLSVPPYNFLWDTTQFPNGTVYLQARAFDLSNNMGVSALRSVIVNNIANQAPYFIYPFNGPTSTVSGVSSTWYARAADPEGGILNYWINWSDGSINTQLDAPSGVPMAFGHTYYAATSTAVYAPWMVVKDYGSPALSAQSGPLTVRVSPAGSATSPLFQPKTLVPLNLQQLNSIQSFQDQLANISAQLQALLLLLSQY